MALRLLKENGETEKITDPRKNLIGLFNDGYKLNTGKSNPVNFGWMMKMMEAQFVTVDNSSGECFIEYPDMGTWQEQVSGFWDDEWAREKMKFHFSYLMKMWGKFSVVEKRRKPTDHSITYVCPKCEQSVTMKRSEWMRFANKMGRCGSCPAQFNVNDVLNKLP